jgi:hypothetical protein
MGVGEARRGGLEPRLKTSNSLAAATKLEGSVLRASKASS